MYSTLKSNPQPSKTEIERSLDGNLCRCTGYRAILDTMKSFAHDEQPIDIEELCKLKCLPSCSKTRPDTDSMHHLSIGDKDWYAPSSLAELKLVLARREKVRFVYGNTSIGVYKRDGPFDSYVNIKNVVELCSIDVAENCVTIGSNTTLTKLIETFKELSSKQSLSKIRKFFYLILMHLLAFLNKMNILKVHFKLF
jgi:xanthine dehydrogenase/oxidase